MPLLCAMSNKDAYRNFCQTAEDLPIFAQDWYLDAVCCDGDWDVAIVKKNAQIAATMPYFFKQKRGFTYSTIPLHTRHLGPYVIPERRGLKNEMSLYAALIEQLPKTAHFIQDFAPTVTNWLPFYWKDFKQTVRYTYILKLDDMDAVLKNRNRRIRRNIEKAEEIVTIGHDISIADFYEINKMSFSRQDISIYYPLESLLKLDAVLTEKKAREIFVARDVDGNIHAVGYLVWDKNRSYALLGGINSEYRSSNAITLLIWKMILYTKEVLNLPIFDFAGSMLPQIEPSRRQFGGEQEPYFRVWKYGSQVFKIVDGLRGFLK